MADSRTSEIMIEIGYATVKLLFGNMMVFKSTLVNELTERMVASGDDEYKKLLNESIEFLHRNVG
ncbi:hypothetical protein AB7092_13435 [Providencia rettgeri]|uniref:Uncharacterized protein n=1 Tax=Providencia hangzhouensis TaxID=3031799 RepID=A0ABY9ZCY0_9GAMM|nr:MULTISPECIES: hypothetical protein [Providencia]ELR5119128.1 hypothetical protein [Providencia rettgeri]ELR5231489.1 hypothetical protein [Providencia rettgeri]MBN4863402.1 hypothetical protein [Providencia stuartii]MBN4876339.1 hypothetical protein [Providencia stuartii]MBN4878155.1 hypothetical protein [Providencia stuartii]